MPPTSIPSSPTTSRLSGLAARGSADTESLFTYGTLQVPDVLHTLLGRVPTRTQATITGWRVVALPQRVYPALIPATDTNQVAGLLLTGLTPAEWALVDAFEDPDYDLLPVNPDHGAAALAYVWRDSTTATERPWSLDGFVDTDLPAYLRNCRTWRDRHTATNTSNSR